jgi:hypothetical protein
MLDNLTLEELLNLSDESFDKYLSPEEISAREEELEFERRALAEFLDCCD